MQASRWPGNVRELRNVVERAAILADERIERGDLPTLKTSDAISDGEANVLRVKVGTRLAEVERRVVLATLEALGGNRPKTAEQLGISLKTLYNRINVYQGHGHHEPSASTSNQNLPEGRRPSG